MPIDRLMADMRYTREIWGPAPSRAAVLQRLADLQPARYRDVLLAYYGVNQPAQTLSELAAALGISRRSAAAVKQYAVRKLWLAALQIPSA